MFSSLIVCCQLLKAVQLVLVRNDGIHWDLPFKIREVAPSSGLWNTLSLINHTQ